VLDGAHARGIGVVLGTPTYAIPMWLARRPPEIATEVETGRRIGWGGRTGRRLEEKDGVWVCPDTGETFIERDGALRPAGPAQEEENHG